MERTELGEQLSEQFLRAPEDFEASQPPLNPLDLETAAGLANLRRRLDRLERAWPSTSATPPGAVDRLAASVAQLQQQVKAL